MVVIRRLIDRHRAYTAIFLPGEEPQVIPTTDYEHGRILQIYKQDRPHPDVHNDFTDFLIGERHDAPPAPEKVVPGVGVEPTRL